MGYRYRVCTQVPLETCDVVQNKQQPQRNIETHRHADYKKKVPHHSMSWVSNLLSHLLRNQCLSESGRERQTPKHKCQKRAASQNNNVIVRQSSSQRKQAKHFIFKQ